jgi:hypothetical protein
MVDDQKERRAIEDLIRGLKDDREEELSGIGIGCLVILLLLLWATILYL